MHRISRNAFCDVDPVELVTMITDGSCDETDLRGWIRKRFNPGVASAVARTCWSEPTHVANIDSFPDPDIEQSAALAVTGYLTGPDTSTGVLDHLHGSYRPLRSRRDWLIGLTGHPHCSSALLDFYAAHDDVTVVGNVARHPSTTSDTLDRLAAHPSTLVQVFVARNPNTSTAALSRLSRSGSSTVLLAVLEHLDCPPVIVERLATHSDPIVACRAVTHRRCGLHAAAGMRLHDRSP